MLDKLLDFLLNFWEQMLPWKVVEPYEEGVLTRLGKLQAKMSPGFYWKIPFADKILTCNVKPDTIRLEKVTVTIKEGRSVAVEVIVGFKVVDSIKFMTEFNDSVTNMYDTCRGVAAEEISDIDQWDKIRGKTIRTSMKNTMQKACEELGVTIMFIKFSTITQTRVFTVFRDNHGKAVLNSVVGG